MAGPPTLVEVPCRQDGLASATARPSRAGLRLSFTRTIENPVSIEVFRESRGRRITRTTRVALFTSVDAAVTWDGRDFDGRRAGDGAYFVRFRMDTRRGLTDGARVAVHRIRGRFVVRRAYAARDDCSALAAFKLGRSVFGGRPERPLPVAFRLRRPSSVRLDVHRNGRVVRTLFSSVALAGRTYRLRLRAAGLPRGDYELRIVFLADGVVVLRTLLARRL